MIKFFRKYNKRLLTIVTIFLMIAFVGGVGLESLLAPSPYRTEIGQAFGEEISQGHLNEIDFETRLLTRLGLNWRIPWLDQSLPPLEEMDYLLLQREARQQGVKPDALRTRVFLQQMEESGRDLNKFCLDNNVATSELERVVANFLTVQQMWETARQSVMTSELQIQSTIRREQRSLNASILQVDSEELVDETVEIPEETLLAQFNEYKDAARGSGPLSFGYLIPDRVAVEYIAIRTGDIELQQPVTTLQAQRYWLDHQQEFKRSAEELAVPTSPPLPAVYQTFAEAKSQVLDKLQTDARLSAGREMADTLWNLLRQPWYGLSPTDSGFLDAPPAVREAGYYETLLSETASQLRYPQVVEVGRSDLFSAADASTVERIGGASEDTQGRGVARPFGSTTHLVQGLIEQAPEGVRLLSLYETAPGWLIDDDNTLYLYRVVSVDPRHAPESLDQVRDQVVADQRLERAYEESKRLAEQVAPLVAEAGFPVAWDSYEGLPSEVKTECCGWFEAKPFPRKAPEFFGIKRAVTISDVTGATDADGNPLYRIEDQSLVDKIFELVDLEGPDASGAISVPTLAMSFVVQLQGIDDITTIRYEALKPSVRQMVNLTRLNQLKTEWFSSDQIRARARFQLKT